MSVQSSADNTNLKSRLVPEVRRSSGSLSISSVSRRQSVSQRQAPKFIKTPPTPIGDDELYPQSTTPPDLLSPIAFPGPGNCRIRKRIALFCIILIITTSLTIVSRKLQNQTISQIDGHSLHFHHHWIQTWLFCAARFLLIFLALCRPFYNPKSGISNTYHSQVNPNNTPFHAGFDPFHQYQSRHQRFKRWCLRQLVHCAMALLLVTSQFLLNFALFWMTASLWTLFFSMIILYTTLFKFLVLKASLIVFFGVSITFIGIVVVIDTEIKHQHNSIYTSCYAIFCMVPGLLCIAIYHMTYDYFFCKFKYWREVLIALKTVRKAKLERLHLRFRLIVFSLI